MRKPREEPVPGEWKYDSLGRKYREIGKGCIEYAPTIQTTAGTVYLDELEEHNKRRKEHTEKRIQEAREAVKKADTRRDCPFKLAKAVIHKSCDKSCVFYEDTACIFASIDSTPTRNTKDRPCPIARKCTDKCAMYYNNGCTLINTIKGMKPGKE